MSSENKADEANSVAVLLATITALPAPQRLSLFNAWMSLDETLKHNMPVSMDGQQVGSVEAVREQESAEIEGWIKSLKSMPSQLQLAKLDDAYKEEQEEWAREMIAAAKESVIANDPVLSVESSLKAFAYEHPVRLVFGVVGILALIYQLGRAVLHIWV